MSVAEQTLPDGRSYRLAGDLDGSEPRPLIVALHGLRLSPDHLDSISGLTEFAAGRHAAVAYGRGLDASWNAGPCCGESARRQVDDLAYLEAVVAHTAARVPIDRARVYAVGFSTGGMMAARAACERPSPPPPASPGRCSSRARTRACGSSTCTARTTRSSR